jgi:beta-xylosidase
MVILHLAVAVASSLAHGDAPPGHHDGPPRLDHLRDAAICADGAGGWLLTGTAGTFDRSGKVDFDYNRGAPLWRSRNLSNWSDGSYAWDRVQHLAQGKPKLGIWTVWGAPADRIDGLLACATTTPRLYQVQGAWYLLCAQNGANILVQRADKPEGPYQDHGYLATRGGTPSLFQDDDAALYLVFADGWFARLQSDLHELAEAPRPLAVDPASGRQTLGDPGVAVFKRGTAYQALAARWRVRDGKPVHDAVLWTSSTLAGPYAETATYLPDTGPVTVFADGATWKAVSSRTAATPRIVVVPEAK